MAEPQDNALAFGVDESLRVFPVKVLRVDHEKPSLSVMNLSTQVIIDNVVAFPTVSSSLESSDDTLPDVGQIGIGTYSTFNEGAAMIVVLTWMSYNHVAKLDAIAMRDLPSTPASITGWATRHRGVHRKAYPGQRSATNSHGLHQFEGSGWDRLAADLSQDRLDADRRQRTQLTGRKVSYDESGLRLSGPVNRPGAAPLAKETLPDGTTRSVAYLLDGAGYTDRYFGGKSDVVPLTEVMAKVQEFALDYPLPCEVLESSEMDTILGTTADLWARTTVVRQNGIARDDQSFLADQDVDDKDNPSTIPGSAPCGPSGGEGNSPRRRGWMIEKAEGTLVGYNTWDTPTYGFPLKPTLWPLTKADRFGTNVETGHLPVATSPDHVETRLAATAFMVRFPYEYNTTRFQVTKEGQVQVEIGATMPRENIGFDSNPTTGSTYEHPWGAGRSFEAHLVGSAKMVIGKNRDEEDSLDLTTLGQVVMRLGADDGSLPNVGRQVITQIRGSKDAHLARSLQYWSVPTLKPGDAGSLNAGQKTGAENVSLRAALDGGTFLRLGARNPLSKRRHLVNGYVDGPGRQQDVPGSGTGARTKGRPVYGVGDAIYQFNDLTQAGSPLTNLQPYFWSGDPTEGGVDYHGQSLDAHAVRDIFLRVGKNNLSGQSILIDLDGGIVGIVGQDKKGRSMTGDFQGGIELTVGSSNNGQAIQLDILGNVNMVIQGHYHVYATGDICFNAEGSIHTVAHENISQKGTRIESLALVQHVTQCADIVHDQGGLGIHRDPSDPT